jgi:hypothetical protein
MSLPMIAGRAVVSLFVPPVISAAEVAPGCRVLDVLDRNGRGGADSAPNPLERLGSASERISPPLCLSLRATV